MSRGVVPQRLLGRLLEQWHSSGSDPIYVVSSNAPDRFSKGHPVSCGSYEAALANVERSLAGAKARKFGWTAKDERQLKAAKKLLESSIRKACLRGAGDLSGFKRSRR